VAIRTLSGWSRALHRESIIVLPTGTVLNGSELIQFQRRSARHLSFSLTTACPLRCSHCLVATVSAKDHASVALPRARAERYASEMPDLVQEGIERISFTGGEPLLAEDVLQILSSAASRAGIECTVVTACHWAKSSESAAEVVRRFEHVRRWHLSWDRYHAEFLPATHVVNAANAVLAAGKEVLVRAAVPRPASETDERLLSELFDLLPAGVELAIQPVSKAGRASALDLVEPVRRANPNSAASADQWVPCMTTGPLVLASGQVRPCCSSLADEFPPNAFRPASTHERGLVDGLRQWRSDPLLKLVRAIGFAPVIDWARDTLDARELPEHPCDQCMRVWRSPGAAEAVAVQLKNPRVVQKIDAVHELVFGPNHNEQGGRHGNTAAGGDVGFTQ
jgi:organic radical activating enzyme